MFKNYLKIALRTIWRDKTFSFINICGLAIGIATCLLISLFVINELSYDKFNKNADRIVRVIFMGTVQGEKMREASVMPPTAQTLKNDYPEVVEATRIRNYGRQKLVNGDKTLGEENFAFADSNIFRVFTLPLTQGDPNKALQDPNSIVISVTAAGKYFPGQNPMGRLITIKGQPTPYKVTGVMQDIPVNSHFHFDLIAAMSGIQEARENSWMTSDFYTYLLLPEGYNYINLEKKLPLTVDKYMGPQFLKGMGFSLADYRKKGNDIGLFLQPLTDIHLHSDLSYDFESGGDLQQVYILSAIAVFMLMIACINFMNLSTAGAGKRSREVGIRKVLGSLRSQLVWQFLAESFFLTLIALIIAIVLVKYSIPLFNELSGKQLSFQLFSFRFLITGVLLFAVLVGLIAGIYPAFFLSAFKPVTVLKGFATSGNKNSIFRSGLVVFQFFISIGLMIGTLVVYQQLQFIQQKQVGYSKDQLIVMPETWHLGNNAEAFKNEISRDPRVAYVSTSYYLPAGPSGSNNFFLFPDTRLTDMVKTLGYYVDANYIPAFNMKMAAGRNFSKEFGTDTASIIINETAARQFGWGNQAIGHTLRRGDNEGKYKHYHVIGIVKDFNFKSLHEQISPLVMVLDHGGGYFIIKTKTKEVSGLVAELKKNWTAMSPDMPFDYTFMDDMYRKVYKSDEKTGQTLALFAGLTIIIACMGLFGLTIFTAEKRTREIGIRKVLGATVQGIVALLSKEFLKLVLVANLIAWPLAWLLMNKWLQNFAYRINFHWWYFVLAGAVALLIALTTVGFHALKAALANPVKSLRSE
jgi:putative ABC transport system permease protein